MKQFADLTKDEKISIRLKAREYYFKHRDSVLKEYEPLRDEESVAPSGSDLFHPELWKGIHWRWFKCEYLKDEWNMDYGFYGSPLPIDYQAEEMESLKNEVRDYKISADYWRSKYMDLKRKRT